MVNLARRADFEVGHTHTKHGYARIPYITTLCNLTHGHVRFIIKLVGAPKYCTVRLKNRRKGTDMNRCYIHAKFRRPLRADDDSAYVDPKDIDMAAAAAKHPRSLAMATLLGFVSAALVLQLRSRGGFRRIASRDVLGALSTLVKSSLGMKSCAV